MSVKAISSFGRTTKFAFAALTSAVLLVGCGSSTADQVDDQVAIAKEAADRATKAQKAAERAAKLARAQSGTATFGEDEIFDDVNDSPREDMSDSSYDDSSDASDGPMVDEASAGPPPR